MVKDYLINLQDEAISRKIDLERRLEEVSTRIKENRAVYEVLQDQLDSSSVLFTPRELYPKNSENISALQNEYDELSDLQLEIGRQITEQNEQLTELAGMIKLARINEFSSENVRMNEDEKFRLKVLKTQEEERQRIAREIHDSPVQSLTGALHKLEYCSRLIDKDRTKCAEELKEIAAIIKVTVSDMRQLIYDLRPMSFEDSSFEELVKSEISKMKSDARFEIDIQEDLELPSIYTLTFLRIVKEACSNSIEHGQADLVIIRARKEDGYIILDIKDNGTGFKEEELPSEVRENYTGNGLSMMKERVYLLSGILEFPESKNGAHIKVTVPEPEKENVV